MFILTYTVVNRNNGTIKATVTDCGSQASIISASKHPRWP